MNNKLIMSVFMMLISFHSSSKDIFLATPYGTFTSCKQAEQFKDGKLFQMHSQAFNVASDSTKIARYKATLEEFQLQKKAAVLALKTASREQRQEMTKTALLAVLFYQLGQGENYKKILPKLSDVEQTALAHLAERAAIFSQAAIERGFKSSKNMESLFKDQLFNNSVFIGELLKVNPLLFIVAKGTIDTGFVYWDGEIKKTDAKNEIEIFNQAINEIITKHPEMKLREINNLKNQIDEMCN